MLSIRQYLKQYFHLFDFRFTAQQKKIVAILLAAVIVAGVVAIFIVFDRQNKSERERAAVVTNGIECSELAGFVINQIDLISD